MIFDQEVLFGIAATAAGLCAYAFYFRDIFRGTTKPHPFSWFVWGLLAVIVFAAQVIAGAGAAAWVTAVTALFCVIIASIGLRHGIQRIRTIDWICFLLALVAVGLWIFTYDPLSAVVVVLVADMLAFVPTIRKSFSKPAEETALLYMFNGAKFVISFFAIAEINATTLLYPTVWGIANIVFAILLVVRRRQLA